MSETPAGYRLGDPGDEARYAYTAQEVEEIALGEYALRADVPPRAARPTYQELEATVLRWHAATPRLCAAVWSASAFAERRAAEEALRSVAGRLTGEKEAGG